MESYEKSLSLVWSTVAECKDFPVSSEVVLMISGIRIQLLEVQWCRNLKKFRKGVSVMLKLETLITLKYRGQNLDDHEYLISYGCCPRMRNNIKAEIYYHQNSNDYYLAELLEAAHEEPTSNENIRENRDSYLMELGYSVAFENVPREAHKDVLEAEKNQIFAIICEPLSQSNKPKLRSSHLNLWSYLWPGKETPNLMRPYRIPYAHQQESRRQKQQMLDNNIIRRSFSAWGFPVVLVEKKDRSIR